MEPTRTTCRIFQRQRNQEGFPFLQGKKKEHDQYESNTIKQYGGTVTPYWGALPLTNLATNACPNASLIFVFIQWRWDRYQWHSVVSFFLFCSLNKSPPPTVLKSGLNRRSGHLERCWNGRSSCSSPAKMKKRILIDWIRNEITS